MDHSPIFVQKFNFDKTLPLDIFEFLRQNSKIFFEYFILKIIKYLNFRAKNLDFASKLNLQNFEK